MPAATWLIAAVSASATRVTQRSVFRIFVTVKTQLTCSAPNWISSSTLELSLIHVEFHHRVVRGVILLAVTTCPGVTSDALNAGCTICATVVICYHLTVMAPIKSSCPGTQVSGMRIRNATYPPAETSRRTTRSDHKQDDQPENQATSTREPGSSSPNRQSLPAESVHRM